MDRARSLRWLAGRLAVPTQPFLRTLAGPIEQIPRPVNALIAEAIQLGRILVRDLLTRVKNRCHDRHDIVLIHSRLLCRVKRAQYGLPWAVRGAAMVFERAKEPSGRSKYLPRQLTVMT